MSDRIHELIDGIREKASSLHSQLSTERSTNQKLQEEVEGLRKQLSARDGEIAELSLKMDELETKLNTTSEREVIGSESMGVSNEEIDELVKEIEYCIGQLKK